MIADLKSYPEYKDSGLPWVGQVPAHWAQRRMKFLFRERTQKGFSDEPLLAASVPTHEPGIGGTRQPRVERVEPCRGREGSNNL